MPFAVADDFNCPADTSVSPYTRTRYKPVPVGSTTASTPSLLFTLATWDWAAAFDEKAPNWTPVPPRDKFPPDEIAEPVYWGMAWVVAALYAFANVFVVAFDGAGVGIGADGADVATG